MGKHYGIPVLMYHSLVKERRPHYHRTVVTQEAFAAQMAWLHKNGYVTVSLNQAASRLTSGAGGKYVVITFDDGYTSTVASALPVLQSYGFTATLFLCTGGVATESHPEALAGRNDIPLEDKPLTVREIETLFAKSWQIEAHSQEHLNHVKIKEEAVATEMDESSTCVELWTGTKPIAYAFPFGAYNKRTLALAAKRFEFCLTTHQGLWTAQHDRLRIPRVEVNSQDSIIRFSRKIATGYGSITEAVVGRGKEKLRKALP